MDSEKLALRARAILTEDDDAVIFSVEKLIALIPTALDMLVDRYAENSPEKLSSFKTVTNIAIASDKVDLSTFETAGGRLDLLNRADITVAYDGNPRVATVQFVNSMERLTARSIQGDSHVCGYIRGGELLLSQGMGLTGNVSIYGVVTPTDVTVLPDTLEGDLAKTIAEIAAMEVTLPRKAVNASERTL